MAPYGRLISYTHCTVKELHFYTVLSLLTHYNGLTALAVLSYRESSKYGCDILQLSRHPYRGVMPAKLSSSPYAPAMALWGDCLPQAGIHSHGQ